MYASLGVVRFIIDYVTGGYIFALFDSLYLSINQLLSRSPPHMLTTPDNKEPAMAPGYRTKVSRPIEAAEPTAVGKLSLNCAITSDWSRAKAVWTLAASPPLAMKDEHPDDVEIVRRLQVLAEERS
jgi:hypothetical protein